ncbi:MAG: hypothetical protein LKG27_00910 [Clostridiaceae bacterium]|nr:hypothetical protein [Clostridiaceae bacterium]
MLCPAVFADDDEKLPNIFIWSTPSLNTKPVAAQDDENADASDSDYMTDDEAQARADKKDAQILRAQEIIVHAQEIRKDKKDKEDLPLVQVSDDDVVSAAILKGYAEYMDGVNDVYLKDTGNNFTFNIKKPQKLAATSINLKKAGVFQNKYTDISKFNNEEYKISTLSATDATKIGHLEFGTTYGSDLDTSALEYSSGLFAKYNYKRFSLATAYSRTLGTMSGAYSDTFSLEPGIKFNDIFSIKERLSANMTYNLKSAELVLSVTPFAKRGNDRLNFELGAKQSFDQQNSLYKSQIRFSTMFKL